MSETIQVTVIAENERQERQEIKVTHDSGVTLMTTLLKKELISGNFCGGRGACKRCRVRFLQAAPLPTSLERQAFTPDELRLGYRLACMARPRNDCVIRLEFVQSRKIEILTDTADMMDVSGKSDHFGQNERAEKRCLIAVDLGTTTIAMQLMDIDSGQALDTYCAMNPQRSYGADVLSRIQAANAGAADALRESVWKVLRKGVSRFYDFCHTAAQGISVQEDSVQEVPDQGDFEQENIERKAFICCMCIAGNTTMEHLLMGLSTERLGKSPFMPVELGLQKCTLPFNADVLPEGIPNGMPDGILDGIPSGHAGMPPEPAEEPSGLTGKVKNGFLPVYIAPGISAFVGGDIAAGLYTLNMRGAALFIDLGTNGEMAVTDGKRMIVTATAAGPAFEGGPGKAVAGSDMVAVTAYLLKKGIIDETGLMAEPYFEEGVTVSLSDAMNAPGSSDSVYLTQKDIRDLQMAKAAVRAGVEVLWQRIGCPEISQVYLAGGFGYYLDVEAAAVIGLLPEKWKRRTKAVGNTSLAGAFQMGKDLWTGKLREEALDEMLRGIESINLAEQKEFEALYIQYMDLRLS